MILKKESLQNQNQTFLNILTFKNSKVLIPNEMLNTNTIIKGARRTGKTEKVLVPASLESTNQGVIYIDYNNESEDILTKKVIANNKVFHRITNKDLDLDKMIKYINQGDFIYFNVRQSNSDDMVNLNKIMDMINNHKKYFTTKVNVFIDNINYNGKINSLAKLIKDGKIYGVCVMLSLCYTSQLEGIYNDEEVKIMKCHSDAYDVEKQY